MWKRALKDTLPELGYHKIPNSIRSVLLVILSLLIVRYLGGESQMNEELRWIISAIVALLVVFLGTFLWNLVRAPVFIRFEREREPKLVVKGIRIYYDGKGVQWLGLGVENPTLSPIPNCYGKLCSRRHVRLELTTINGTSSRPELSLEAGSESAEGMELPHEGHRFPWFPENLAESTITIPGYNGREFLYFAAKDRTMRAFGFPTDMGAKYPNWSLGDFELEIEIGSETLGFQPIRQIVVFRAEGGDLEVISPNVIV